MKQFIKKYSQHAPLPRWAVVKEADLPQQPLKAVGKAIKPGSTETEANPRARSAVLRVAERSSGEFSVLSRGWRLNAVVRDSPVDRPSESLRWVS
ncbi:S-adenosyl-methyltransferase MraW [Neisseria flavescens]|nr:S-adenosyl-methyltransferase MraW [Neisseria flavescens]